MGESFGTIAGYGPNGAVIHYHAMPETCRKVEPEGLLLIDSGGQYQDGTTDITRTVAVGKLTKQMKTDYTHVLKGHIALATAIFPEGTRGRNSTFCSQSFMENGLPTGTARTGIGHLLIVHEGPQKSVWKRIIPNYNRGWSPPMSRD